MIRSLEEAMAKVTMTLCDVRPCTFIADREFEVNGEIVYVCGESCYVKFWSREFRNWKNDRYQMTAQWGVDQDWTSEAVSQQRRLAR
jgi:hypothetical protein